MTSPGRGSARLPRSVGFWGLMFVSLGSIIGSGWLLGALTAAKIAGAASILSWLITAGILSLLALIYAELGATYPVAGGCARFSFYCHGPLTGFTSGWAAWLQAVFIPPIEVLAAITYLNSVDWVRDHFNMLNASGLLNQHGIIAAIALMLGFTAINLTGGKFLSESNTLVMLWKAGVPVLTVIAVAAVAYNASNFTAGGGFMPFGMHGVFAALPAGVVFALQGFEQAVQLAGEARNPQKDLSRAILTAMAIGAVLYTALQIVMIAGFDPVHLATGWGAPLGTAPSAYGAWYTLALALGMGWLAKILLVDAVISPAGTGVVYVGASARLSYALGEQREMPAALTRTNRAGTPVVSIVVAAVVGCAAFGPFKSWQALVAVVTSATAIMYAFAPISLAALHRLDADRPRRYRIPLPGIVTRGAFVSANLIIYWSTYDTTWKLTIAMAIGQLIFAIGAVVAGTFDRAGWRNLVWIAPWLVGNIVIGAFGGYGGSGAIPEWWDLGVMAVFSLTIFELAVRITLRSRECAAAIAEDAEQLELAQHPPFARVVT